MTRQPLNDRFLRTSFLSGANAAYVEQMQAIGDRLFIGGGIMEDGIYTIRDLALEQVTAENVNKTLKKEIN